jgi:hypothetical protein
VGTLSIPDGGLVYVDAVPLIYAVERHAKYAPVLEPLWEQAGLGRCRIVSSALSLLECLVLPLRRQDAAIIANYERALTASDLQLLDVSQPVIRRAADLRRRGS